jgi:hypothetical protein
VVVGVGIAEAPLLLLQQAALVAEEVWLLRRKMVPLVILPQSQGQQYKVMPVEMVWWHHIINQAAVAVLEGLVIMQQVALLPVELVV